MVAKGNDHEVKGLSAFSLQNSKKLLGWSAVILLSIGSVMNVAASYVVQLGVRKSLMPVVLHEGAWLVIGSVVFVVAKKVRFDWLLSLAPLALIAGIALLAIVLLPGVGVSVGGASRWFQVGIFQVQPSEIIKLVLVIYFARLVGTKNGSSIVGPVLAISALCAGLVFVEPDMGTAIIVFAIGIATLYVAGVRIRTLALVGLMAVLAGMVGAMGSAYRRLRLLSFLHPWRYRADFAYQEVQALASFATGGLFGSGIGTGPANWGYLPNAQTDFIFAVIGQDFGFVGALGVTLLLVVMVWSVLGASLHVREKSERAFVFLCGVWLFVQGVLNIGAVIGLMPVTGVPLPLVSAGGSALVVTLAALGIVWRILESAQEGNDPVRMAGRRGNGRSSQRSSSSAQASRAGSTHGPDHV
jgi:cell division protein FtsW